MLELTGMTVSHWHSDVGHCEMLTDVDVTFVKFQLTPTTFLCYVEIVDLRKIN